MADHSFPAFKLVTLLARQASSPIAKQIKDFAKQHPVFSRVVCARTAELYRYVEWRGRVVALQAAGRVVRAKWTLAPPAPLSPQEAREMGGDILGEFVLFFLGATILIYELNRQAIKQEKKKEAKRAEWKALLGLLEETRVELQRQQETIDRLRGVLRAAGGGGELAAQGWLAPQRATGPAPPTPEPPPPAELAPGEDDWVWTTPVSTITRSSRFGDKNDVMSPARHFSLRLAAAQCCTARLGLSSSQLLHSNNST